MNRLEREERDRSIIELYLTTQHTFGSLGEIYYLTKQRIAQIVYENGFSYKDKYEKKPLYIKKEEDV